MPPPQGQQLGLLAPDRPTASVPTAWRGGGGPTVSGPAPLPDLPQATHLARARFRFQIVSGRLHEHINTCRLGRGKQVAAMRCTFRVLPTTSVFVWLMCAASNRPWALTSTHPRSRSSRGLFFIILLLSSLSRASGTEQGEWNEREKDPHELRSLARKVRPSSQWRDKKKAVTSHRLSRQGPGWFPGLSYQLAR